jgi:hypothetical protein
MTSDILDGMPSRHILECTSCRLCIHQVRELNGLVSPVLPERLYSARFLFFFVTSSFISNRPGLVLPDLESVDTGSNDFFRGSHTEPSFSVVDGPPPPFPIVHDDMLEALDRNGTMRAYSLKFNS